MSLIDSPLRSAGGTRRVQARQHPAKGLGTILTVWAHPDDESFVAGGLLAAASDAGSRIVCLTATRGEFGTRNAEAWPRDRLARTRTRELTAALAVLGVGELRWLSFADGACDQVSAGHGMALVAKVIDEVQPDTIVTFGPDGLTGHSDHRAVSRWTSNAWAATQSHARLLWAAVPPAAATRMAQVEAMIGAFYPGYPEVIEGEDISLHLELHDDLLDRKLVALRAHASQTAALVQRIGEDLFRRTWSSESFINVSQRAVPADARVAA
jgi:LmbE family N-acetylglucosaminyl deacetylase